MKRPAKVWIFTLLTATLFGLIGLYVPRLMSLDGAARWGLRGGIWFLGLAAAVLVFLWASSKWKAEAKDRDADEIDITIAAARKRLAEARGKAAARFGKMPLIVVVGPEGSAKTTIVSRSGLEPELLAGEVLRGDSVMPTSAVNLWYAQDNLVLEAGGPVAADAGRWKRLVKQIQPKRLAAALARGNQAPRVVIVCYGCDELLKPGASESVPASAQKLRARLAEMSQKMGIRLPVYVLFTKADRLPYFDEYVRSLTREEANDVLGVTLKVPPADAAVGAYSERESRRLSEAFNVLFRGLAGRRLELLQRETQEEVKAGIYEFPREFRKVSDLATQFLLDLCRPSQLGVSPFLRGFYFTGVRPVWIHDVGAEQPQQQARTLEIPNQAMDATGVFDPRVFQQQRSAPKPAAGSRKVPEWTFLPRVFSDVLLRDGAARDVTGSGTRVHFLRRTMLATAAGLALLLASGFTWSFFANRGLLEDTRAAVDGVRGLTVTTAALPDVDILQRLDTLRAQAAMLGQFGRNGEPLGLNWLLYAGNRIHPDVRQLYFQRFDDLQWQRTRARLEDYLRALPDSASEASEYDQTYDALRAYIATSTRPDRANRTFLTPALMNYWRTGIQPDQTQADLAAAQFDFFADELPYEPSIAATRDSTLVEETRTFLRGFANDEQSYRLLLASASDTMQAVRWSGPLVQNDAVVPAAFTRQGWERAQAMLADLPSLFDREDWVLGEGTVSGEASEQLAQELRDRYTRDFIDAWQRFLAASAVPRFVSARDAAAKLEQLSTNDSPVMRVLGIVANNTAVDDTLDIRPAFQPVHDLVPPDATSLSETAGRYLNAVDAMKTAFGSLASAPPASQQQAVGEAQSSAEAVRGEVSTIQRSFSTEGEARETGLAVVELLRLASTAADGVISGAPAAAVNAKGGDFCAPFGRLANLYPFDPSSQTEAAVEDLTALLSPTGGALWSFYQSDLSGMIMRQGATSWGTVPGASPEPTPQFLNFFTAAAQASTAMFNPSGAPEILFTLRIETNFTVANVTVSVAGRSYQYTTSQQGDQPFAWTGIPTGARIVARVENETVTVVEVPPGPWSAFRMFHAAEMTRMGGGRYAVTWRVPGSDAVISGELSYPEGVPIFERGFLRPVTQCVSRIAR